MDDHALGFLQQMVMWAAHNARMKICYALPNGWHQGRRLGGVTNLTNRLTWMLFGTTPCDTQLRLGSTYVSFYK